MSTRSLSQHLLKAAPLAYQTLFCDLAIAARKIRRTLTIWNQRAARRKSLRQHLMFSDVRRIENDIGVAPGTLENEAQKPFWKS